MSDVTAEERTGLDLPELVALARGLSEQPTGDAAPVVQNVLRGVRELLGMDVAFLGEFRSGSRVLRHVDAAGPDCPLQAGQSDLDEETYCRRVVDGRLPGLVPDAAVDPEAAALPVTCRLRIGTHLSVPVRFSDGRVYGTFCAFSHEPDPSARTRDLGVLQLVADLLGQYFEREAQLADRSTQAAADVLEVLALGRLRCVFQPIIDLRSGRPAGYEALSRFPFGRPDEWFARAGASGLAVPLELAAVDEAVRHLPRLPDGAYLAVNLSPATLVAPQFADRAGSLPLDRLVIELTEQTEVASYDEMGRRIDWLRARGARVAVDDAGAGYAGLQRIVTINPDMLKLDAQLTRGIGDSLARQAMATAMGWFAERTGAILVAEGVETGDDLETLRELGVDYVQGFHVGAPAPV